MVNESEIQKSALDQMRDYLGQVEGFLDCEKLDWTVIQRTLKSFLGVLTTTFPISLKMLGMTRINDLVVCADAEAGLDEAIRDIGAVKGLVREARLKLIDFGRKR